MSGSTTAIYDPSTGALNGTGRTPFPGNLVPQTRIDPIVEKIVNLTPPPTFPNLLTSNYYTSAPYSYSRGTTDAKMNYYVNEKLNLAVRHGWIRYTMDDPPMFGTLGGTPVSSAGGAYGLGAISIAFVHERSPWRPPTTMSALRSMRRLVGLSTRVVPASVHYYTQGTWKMSHSGSAISRGR
jgi:hypothetical protein